MIGMKSEQDEGSAIVLQESRRAFQVMRYRKLRRGGQRSGQISLPVAALCIRCDMLYNNA